MDTLQVLVAEDDPAQRALLRYVLAGMPGPADVTMVESGAELLQALSTQHPDCILLDYNLPDYQAGDLLPHIERNVSGCSVLVMSSSDDQRIVIDSLRNGCHDFLQKDEVFNSRMLWERIQKARAGLKKQVSERRAAARRLQRLVTRASTDPLTGLGNRAHLRELLRDGRRRNAIDRRGECSVIMLDIDHFKTFNDRFGHAAGDAVLRLVADLLRKSAMRDDLICRWGGEEFVVVRPGSGLARAVAWSEQVRLKISRVKTPPSCAGTPVTASLGVATCPSPRFSEDIIERADKALYIAKNLGRNRVATWEMAAFQALAADIALTGGSPIDRLSLLLSRHCNRLGPTQFEHLTVHAELVSRIAAALGRSLGLPPAEISNLQTAGAFHDVGKLIVPEKILAKPNRLSRDEQYLLSRHAIDSADMSRILGAGKEARRYVMHHHQRFDRRHASSAQPCDFPLGARILAVADAFVAMTSRRPYQPTRTRAAAMAEFQRQRSKQFDPRVVDALGDVRLDQHGEPPA